MRRHLVSPSIAVYSSQFPPVGHGGYENKIPNATKIPYKTPNRISSISHLCQVRTQIPDSGPPHFRLSPHWVPECVSVRTFRIYAPFCSPYFHFFEVRRPPPHYRRGAFPEMRLMRFRTRRNSPIASVSLLCLPTGHTRTFGPSPLLAFSSPPRAISCDVLDALPP